MSRRYREDRTGGCWSRLYDPSLVSRGASLRLSSRSLSESLRAGSFKSLYKGRGVEFSGVRDYFPGDDVRAIDWNVTARMGRPFVKQFEEDRELVLFVVVDSSLSMATGGGTGGRSRLRTGCELAALMVWSVVLDGGAVGGVVFDGDIRYCHRPTAGGGQALVLLSRLEEVLLQERGGLLPACCGTSLDKALRGAAGLLRKPSLVLVVSDFRAVGYERELGILCARHDVVAVRIVDPLDAAMESVGNLPFVDPESGYRQLLPTSSHGFRQAWREAQLLRVERWQALCHRQGARPLVVSTQDDCASSLQHFFSVGET